MTKLNIIFLSVLIMDSCCENYTECNYNSKDAKFLNNTAEVLDILVPYKYGSFNERIAPFEGREYKDLIPDKYFQVRKKGVFQKNLLIDPCKINLTIIYEE